MIQRKSLLINLAIVGLSFASAAQQGGTDPRIGECLDCRELLAGAPDDFAHDPHDFACAECHHPHGTEAQRDWKVTCQTSGCHERAWTETVFHRLDAEVFSDCRRCHLPHSWKAVGSDCGSCHEDVHGERGDVRTTAVAGMSSFSHARHREYECSLCHDSSAKHAKLVMTDRASCLECHHGSSFSDRCDRCHGNGPDAPRDVSLAMSIAGTFSPRELRFDHSAHSVLECTECHGGAGEVNTSASCASCHHDAQARCETCHEAPGADAHDLAVHGLGSCERCHDASPADARVRGICTSCHTAQVGDHYSDRECVACHKVDPE